MTYIHRGKYTWRQYTHERTTKLGNIHTKETTRSAHDIVGTPHGGTPHGGYIIQRGYVHGGDIYMESIYVHGKDIHMERTYRWRGHTHERNIYTEGTYMRRDLHMEEIYTLYRLCRCSELFIWRPIYSRDWTCLLNKN